MGLHVSVFRDSDMTYDCTNNGWSSRYTACCVVNAEGPFAPDEKHPAVLVRCHPTVLALNAVLVEHAEAKKWTMMGGNFLSTSDSRFGELCRRLLEENGARFNRHFGYGAVAIHDRIE